MQRLPAFILSGAFVIALFLPPSLLVLQDQQAVSTAEKRELAGLPHLELSWESLQTFPEQFEQYFKDHFGGRDFLITLNNRILYTFFHKSPSSLITVGRKGWLFYNQDGALLDYLGQWHANFSQLEKYRRILEQRRDWLAGLGSHYIFLPVPNKMMIYDEYLPWRIRSSKGTTFYDQLLDHLDQHSDFNEYINLEDLFVYEKKTGVDRLYFRTDTHWNLNGAFLAQQAIGQRIQEWFPEFELIKRHDLTETTVLHSGDLAVMLHMYGNLVENAPMLRLKHPCSQPQNNTPAADTNRQPEVNGCPERTLTALMVGDSFSHFLKPFLSEYFKEITYVNYGDFNSMKDFIREHRPDVVIDQRVARLLDKALQPDPVEQQEMLNSAFSGMPEVAVRIDGQSALTDFTGVNQLQITKYRQGLELLSTGNDPFLEFKLTQKVEGEILGELRLNSPVQTNFQLFYLTGELEQYSAEATVVLPLVKGENRIVFAFPHDEVEGKIRIDPGQAAGKYILHSLVLKKSGSGK